MLFNATLSGGFIFTSELGVGTSMLKKWAYAVIVLIVMIFPIQIVSAHSPIEKRVPEKDAVLQVYPDKVELFFEESVEIHRSSIIVRNVAKEEVQVGRPRIDPSDDRHILIDVKKNLSPGTYNVDVDVISIDGHGLKESYSFEIKEPPKEIRDVPSLTLDRTFPEDGAILQEPPKQIDLWYSTPTELSVFGLLDDKQQSLDTKKPYVDPNDSKHFIIELSGTLKEGTYSIVSYAKTDDKEDYKIKYFAVKNVTSITGSASSSNDSIWKHIGFLQFAHWLSYLGMFLLVGSSWFHSIITKDNETSLKWKKILPYVYVLSSAAILLELFLTNSGIQKLLFEILSHSILFGFRLFN
jgi:copper transport protein